MLPTRKLFWSHNRHSDASIVGGKRKLTFLFFCFLESYKIWFSSVRKSLDRITQTTLLLLHTNYNNNTTRNLSSNRFSVGFIMAAMNVTNWLTNTGNVYKVSMKLVTLFFRFSTDFFAKLLNGFFLQIFKYFLENCTKGFHENRMYFFNHLREERALTNFNFPLQINETY